MKTLQQAAGNALAVAVQGVKGKAKGSRKNNFTFYTPMHPVWLRCENSEYPDIPAFSRLAIRAHQRLKL
ncbi:MAG: hypothetical protein Q8P24_02605 [Desulfobacterales bacterium]|nr:hypothetical protein [Desulfobacterales bacterium]